MFKISYYKFDGVQIPFKILNNVNTFKFMIFNLKYEIDSFEMNA